MDTGVLLRPRRPPDPKAGNAKSGATYVDGDDLRQSDEDVHLLTSAQEWKNFVQRDAGAAALGRP